MIHATLESQCNFLIALLAHQRGHLDPVQFLDICITWSKEPSRAMAQFLSARGILDPEALRALEEEADNLLDQHEGDARACLEQLMDDSVRESLSHISLPPYVAPKPLPIPPSKSSDDALAETVRPPSLTRGRYQVIGEMGAGGIGVVWRARDPHLGREVALKELRPECATTAASYIGT